MIQKKKRVRLQARDLIRVLENHFVCGDLYHPTQAIRSVALFLCYVCLHVSAWYRYSLAASVSPQQGPIFLCLARSWESRR